MRFGIFCATACAAMLAALPAQAADTVQQSAMKSCAATWKTKADAEKAKTKYADYMSGCMKGPTKGPAPSMAMTAKPADHSSMAMKADMGGKAKCKDGAIVSYKSRSGTCSGHHGVATWM
jgi:hypothetical protein